MNVTFGPFGGHWLLKGDIMVKIILNRKRPMALGTHEGEIQLVRGKEVDVPLPKALSLLGHPELQIKFEKKDESEIKKLKKSRLRRLQREFRVDDEEDSGKLLGIMFPKAARKSPIRKAVKPPVKKEPLKPPIKAKIPKTKPKVDKAKATEK